MSWLYHLGKQVIYCIFILLVAFQGIAALGHPWIIQ